jgi:hypothetical protein
VKMRLIISDTAEGNSMKSMISGRFLAGHCESEFRNLTWVFVNTNRRTKTICKIVSIRFHEETCPASFQFGLVWDVETSSLSSGAYVSGSQFEGARLFGCASPGSADSAEGDCRLELQRNPQLFSLCSSRLCIVTIDMPRGSSFVT